MFYVILRKLMGLYWIFKSTENLWKNLQKFVVLSENT